MKTDIKPWEQQGRESAKAFAAFIAYRDLPPSSRSLVKAVQKSGELPSNVSKWAEWSAKYGWVERVRRWDAEKDRLARESEVKALQDMGRRHASFANGMLQKAASRLAALDPNELSASELRLYIGDAIKLERLARGEPETITEERGPRTVTVRYANENAVDEGDGGGEDNAGVGAETG